MNILFITISWPREGERNIYTDLMDEFIKNGHTVFVVCSDEQGLNKSTRVAIEKKLHILQVTSGNIKKAPYIKKGVALLLLGWQMKSAIRSYYKHADFDLIVCSTPPITLSGLVAYLKNSIKSLCICC